jgi:microcystin-dependent protein
MKFRIAFWLLVTAVAMSVALPAKAQEQYIGEIKFVAFNFAPVGWMTCNGQLLPITQFQPLFALLGTTYGGNGTTNFALPNLQGRLPIATGSGAGLTPRILGETGGQETVTLTVAQIPSHRHVLKASTAAGDSTAPGGGVLANSSTIAIYNSQTPSTTMNVEAISHTGGGQPVGIMPPFLGLTCIIAFEGIFPPRN